ncbi:MAG: NADH-quinone oxidoreductase subunit C [Methanobacteriaceae archaeon]|jgi:NADH:ubiquinone oxidoreductase subunit C|nr:NADH-quinone oxidoreductase subunit C [Methanobacteriaceae archaeon]
MNKQVYNLLNYIIKTSPAFVKTKINLRLSDDTLVIHTSRESLITLLLFLRSHINLQFKTLISITAVDYPELSERFEVNYFLLSYKLNTRITVKVTTDDINPIPSATEVFSSAN